MESYNWKAKPISPCLGAHEAHPKTTLYGVVFQKLNGPLLTSIPGADRSSTPLRELIRERTGEGRRRAMAAGVRFGRPKVMTNFQAAEAVRRRANGEPLSLIAQAYRCSVSTIARLGVAP